jgi:chromosome segregation ATPase
LNTHTNSKSRSPLQASLLLPMNLSMLGLTAAAGLLSAWWMAPIGLLLWLLMIFVVATDPSLRFRLGMEQRGSVAQRFQNHCNRIQRSEAGFYNSLSNSGRKNWRRFQEVMEIVHNLSNEANTLSQRMSALENHRKVIHTNRDLKAEMRMLDVQIEAAPNDNIRRDYEKQRAELEKRVESMKDLEAVLDRVEAELRSLSTELESALTRVIHIQALSAAEIVKELPSMIGLLKKIEHEFGQFDYEVQSYI